MGSQIGGRPPWNYEDFSSVVPYLPVLLKVWECGNETQAAFTLSINRKSVQNAVNHCRIFAKDDPLFTYNAKTGKLDWSGPGEALLEKAKQFRAFCLRMAGSEKAHQLKDDHQDKCKKDLPPGFILLNDSHSLLKKSVQNTFFLYMCTTCCLELLIRDTLEFSKYLKENPALFKGPRPAYLFIGKVPLPLA